MRLEAVGGCLVTVLFLLGIYALLGRFLTFTDGGPEFSTKVSQTHKEEFERIAHVVTPPKSRFRLFCADHGWHDFSYYVKLRLTKGEIVRFLKQPSFKGVEWSGGSAMLDRSDLPGWRPRSLREPRTATIDLQRWKQGWYSLTVTVGTASDGMSEAYLDAWD